MKTAQFKYYGNLITLKPFVKNGIKGGIDEKGKFYYTSKSTWVSDWSSLYQDGFELMYWKDLAYEVQEFFKTK